MIRVQELLTLSERGNVLEEQNVDYALEVEKESGGDVLLEIVTFFSVICTPFSSKVVIIFRHSSCISAWFP